MKKILLTWVEESNEKIILKRAAFWNMVASLLNALMSSILLFFITRLGGVTEAGIFSIASAIAYQVLSLGKFGSRNVQVSDVLKKYSFSDFFWIRIFSGTLMFFLLMYYAFGSGYTFEKGIAVFSFGLFKAIDCFEDIIHGEYQRNNRLDIASILLSFRYVFLIFEFVVFYYFLRNLTLVSLISCISGLLICYFENKDILLLFFKDKLKLNLAKFKQLFWILVPITIANYVKMYSVNLPKYAIDSYLSEEIQTYFNVLMMPVFVISLLSDVVFAPFVTKLSIKWHEKDLPAFSKLILRQIIVIVTITIIVMLGGYVIGLTLIELIYGLELHKYMLQLEVLLLAGGMNTLSSLFNLVLTIQKQQNKFMVIYLVVMLLGIVSSKYLVSYYGITGATVLYLLICTITFFAFLGLSIHTSIKYVRTFEKD